MFKTNELTELWTVYFTNLLSNISRRVVANQAMSLIASDKTLIRTTTSNLDFFNNWNAKDLFLRPYVNGQVYTYIGFFNQFFFYFVFPFALCIHNCCGYFMGFFCRRCGLLLWVTFTGFFFGVKTMWVNYLYVLFFFSEDDVGYLYVFGFFFLDLIA